MNPPAFEDTIASDETRLPRPHAGPARLSRIKAVNTIQNIYNCRSLEGQIMFAAVTLASYLQA